MGQRLDRFFADSPKALRLFSLGFMIAAIGAAVAFSIDYGPTNPLSYVTFGLGVVGVGIGFVAIAWGWYTSFKGGPGTR